MKMIRTLLKKAQDHTDSHKMAKTGALLVSFHLHFSQLTLRLKSTSSSCSCTKLKWGTILKLNSSWSYILRFYRKRLMIWRKNGKSSKLYCRSKRDLLKLNLEMSFRFKLILSSLKLKSWLKCLDKLSRILSANQQRGDSLIKKDKSIAHLKLKL